MTGRQMAPVEVCQDCGRCCTRLSVGVSLQPKMAALFKAHYGREVEHVRFTVHHRCPHLTNDGLCDLWNENPEFDGRPEICQEFMCEKAEHPEMIVLELEGLEG